MERVPLDIARGLIDSEYDDLTEMNKVDLYQYLCSHGIQGMTKELSDDVYDEFFNEDWLTIEQTDDIIAVLPERY